MDVNELRCASLVEILAIAFLLMFFFAVIILPFVIIVWIFVNNVEEKSRGVITMLLGFLLMGFGSFFIFVFHFLWPQKFLVTASVSGSRVGIEFSLLEMLLWAIPLAWVVFSFWVVKKKDLMIIL